MRHAFAHEPVGELEDLGGGGAEGAGLATVRREHTSDHGALVHVEAATAWMDDLHEIPRSAKLPAGRRSAQQSDSPACSQWTGATSCGPSRPPAQFPQRARGTRMKRALLADRRT